MTVTDTTSTSPDVVDALTDLLSSIADGGSIRLLRLTRAPRAQERVDRDPDAQESFDRGLAVRAAAGLPFWDAVMLATEESETGAPLKVFEAALLHQPLPLVRAETVVVDNLLRSRLRAAASDVASGEVVALESTIMTATGVQLHLPMLDFASKAKRPGARGAVEAAVRALGMPGLLLESGQSFHFYGRSLMDADAMQTFLTRAVLLAPVVDQRWVAHQLLERACSLRISPTSRGGWPRLIAELW